MFGFVKKKPKVTAELEEELSQRPLNITGKIPVWLTGTLIRNGPIKVTIDGKSNEHWFDGLAMLHAFTFDAGKVHYSNRFLRTDPYRTVFEKRSLCYDGFAADPCRFLFKRFFTLFDPTAHLGVHNANVNVTKLADDYVALTEVPLPVKFDLQTLATLGVLDYQDQLPKDKCFESAHPHHDGKRGETLNYITQFGCNSCYTLYRIEDGTTTRKTIADIPVDKPAYMHSFAMTENYVIITEFPLVVNPIDLVIERKAFIKNFTWQPQRGTRFIVVDRSSGTVVGEYMTKPFFAFHHANAFEDGDSIHIDICTYEDADVIIKGALNIDSRHIRNVLFPTKLERFSLSLKSTAITSEVLLASPNEFPRINSCLDGKPYRYLYLTGLSKYAFGQEEVVNSSSLYKFDVVSKKLLEWAEEGCLPGEPVFVSAPDAKDEDEGVVLAVIIDHLRKDSFLLVLDAKSFQELGRARAPHIIPEGFHGQFYRS